MQLLQDFIFVLAEKNGGKLCRIHFLHAKVFCPPPPRRPEDRRGKDTQPLWLPAPQLHTCMVRSPLWGTEVLFRRNEPKAKSSTIYINRQVGRSSAICKIPLPRAKAASPASQELLSTAQSPERLPKSGSLLFFILFFC